MGYDMYTLKGEDYFRANIWGMQILRAVMEDAGILDWEASHAEWPKHDCPKGATDKEVTAYDKMYEKKCLPLRRSRSSQPDMVPGFKFSSNDGWIVVPEECDIIQRKMSEFLEEGYNGENLEFIQEFVVYCKGAVSKGGFKVW